MEASKVCLDTDVIVELLRGREPIVTRLKELEGERARFLTTSVNVFELYYGCWRSKRVERNLEAVKKLLERLEILDFTEEAAREAGNMLARLEAKGFTVDLRDLFIGCIALVNGCALLTENIEHFQRFEGLKILSV
jgi:predicted nucleic acid-binding protein